MATTMGMILHLHRVSVLVLPSQNDEPTRDRHGSERLTAGRNACLPITDRMVSGHGVLVLAMYHSKYMDRRNTFKSLVKETHK